MGRRKEKQSAVLAADAWGRTVSVVLVLRRALARAIQGTGGAEPLRHHPLQCQWQPPQRQRQRPRCLPSVALAEDACGAMEVATWMLRRAIARCGPTTLGADRRPWWRCNGTSRLSWVWG